MARTMLLPVIWRKRMATSVREWRQWRTTSASPMPRQAFRSMKSIARWTISPMEGVAAVEAVGRKARVGIVRDYVGHGCGIKLHEPPEVPNFTSSMRGPQLEPGMVLAIEPMFNQGTGKVTTDRVDGWTVRTFDGLPSAHFEHMVLITEKEPEILTWPKTM